MWYILQFLLPQLLPQRRIGQLQIYETLEFPGAGWGTRTPDLPITNRARLTHCDER